MSFPQSPPSLSPVPSNRFDLTSGARADSLSGTLCSFDHLSLTLLLPQTQCRNSPLRKLRSQVLTSHPPVSLFSPVMADNESEEAFFKAQAMGSDSAVAADTDESAADNFDEEEEYDPSRTFDDQYQSSEQGPQQTEEALEDEDQQQQQQQQDEDEDEDEPESEVTAPNPTASSDMDTGIASDAPDPAQNPSRDESQKSTPVPPAGVSAQPQTRTIGGFDIEDDEDEGEDDNEEADYEPPAVLGVDDSDAMPMTMSENPSSGNQNHTTSPDVSSHLVQPSASGLDVANSSYSPAPVSNIDPSASGSLQWAHDPSMQNSTVPTPVPDSPSLKGRMAHDRVGILQDRVDEDPRGDLSAWLELIAEHRARNRLDSAREVYERFLKEFPMAVSLDLASRIWKTLTLTNRLINGWRTPLWSRSSMNSSVWNKFSIEHSLLSLVFSFGPSTWTMSVAGTLCLRIAVDRQDGRSRQLMISQFNMWGWTKTAAIFGLTTWNSFALGLVLSGVQAGRTSRRWICSERPTRKPSAYPHRQSIPCGRNMISSRWA